MSENLCAPLVSVIMPLYNAERYVEEAISSVRSQTLTDWELIVVDDGSTDGSAEIVSGISARDGRIKLISHKENRGAAEARNTCLSHVRGAYVAYMDSDDLWMPEKLERQLAFMGEAGSPMCFTAYETVEENGAHRNYVRVPERIDYGGFLKNTVTCSHTIVFDLSKVELDWLRCPAFEGDYDVPEDMVVWLQVLKRDVEASGLNEVLAKYRKHGSSRSASVTAAVGRTWNVYRKVEGLSLPYSTYCLFWQLTHALIKRMRN